jgi:hypothetical protein
MTTIGDRVSQLSSAASVYGAFNNTAGADGQTNSAADGAHGSRLALDEMTRLMLVASRSSTGGQITSTTTANQQALSTGLSPFGIASTRYVQSGQP